MHKLTSMGAMLCDVVVVLRTKAPASHLTLTKMNIRKWMHGFYRYGASHGGLRPPVLRLKCVEFLSSCKHWKLDICNSIGSSLFSDFKSELSRTVCFPSAGQGERRPWLRGWTSLTPLQVFYACYWKYAFPPLSVFLCLQRVIYPLPPLAWFTSFPAFAMKKRLRGYHKLYVFLRLFVLVFVIRAKNFTSFLFTLGHLL